jgi:hypothetical protein
VGFALSWSGSGAGRGDRDLVTVHTGYKSRIRSTLLDAAMTIQFHIEHSRHGASEFHVR